MYFASEENKKNITMNTYGNLLSNFTTQKKLALGRKSRQTCLMNWEVLRIEYAESNWD